jgi:hypothetical protein
MCDRIVVIIPAYKQKKPAIMGKDDIKFSRQRFKGGLVGSIRLLGCDTKS